MRATMPPTTDKRNMAAGQPVSRMFVSFPPRVRVTVTLARVSSGVRIAAESAGVDTCGVLVAVAAAP
jgi:hypothetical protein